jgi:uncharacterized RDD family membrane protein YckC
MFPEIPESTARGVTVNERRIVAGIVDVIALLVILALMTALFGESSSTESGGASFELSGLPFIVTVALWFLYYLVPEMLTAKTLGKKLLGLRVVSEDGTPYGPGKAFLRNLLRLVDGLPVLYLLGVILVVVTPKHQRIGDMAAGTLVVRD